jgi:hypothetical protein
MHPGIRPPCAYDLYLMIGDPGQCLLDHRLNTGSMVLTLPTGKATAIVLDPERKSHDSDNRQYNTKERGEEHP